MVKIIGAGLAGCEAALRLSALGIKCKLVDCKPHNMSAAHKSGDFAELVCSNSLKSNDFATAGGLLKQELRLLKSPLIGIADVCGVPAGGALAVDRALFSRRITERILSDPNIIFESQLVTSFEENEPTIIATGPLTLSPLIDFLETRLGESLHFFDAAAPIVSEDSIDFSSAFIADRYGKNGRNMSLNDVQPPNVTSESCSEDKSGVADWDMQNETHANDTKSDASVEEAVGGGAYVNCPLTKEEYYNFIDELVCAETVIKREFEKGDVFEGCMPIEVMAARGRDSLRFGPLKPVGLFDRMGKRPYAVVQLRRENAAGSMYNLVGFQTNLKFPEQQRVFSLIPALKNAEFLRFGVMHRNSFINAPVLLNTDFSLKKSPLVFVAGQLSGVEGYCESIMSGHIAALSISQKLAGGGQIALPNDTMCGVLSGYIAAENHSFQPMNANFGLLPPLENHVRDKQLRKKIVSSRAIESMTGFIKSLKL